ncbi:serine hydrolase [Streptomyces sp. NPDC051183]|uniref:D-alanyl-D-alanine carboxypeptidase family protein n=1 Tax=unclassified Streptomyces TaxID=2593676 RepID=UPI0034206320
MPAKHHRTSYGQRRSVLRRSALVPLSAVLALVTGTGAWYAFGGDGPRSADGAAAASLAGSLDLPWPAEGQASAEVEGIGSLGSKGEQVPVPIASITKVMTAYVILNGHPMSGDGPGEQVKADQQAADESFSTAESTAPVLAGHQYTQQQLLELMMLPSGNNVARLLARWDSGDQQRFTAKMNKAAAALGMNRTTYTGASGIETDTTSTAADQLKLARAVMMNEAFRRIVATPSVTAPGVGTQIQNSNKLLGQDGVIGLKTGSSTPAGGNLMWAATQEAAGAARLILGVVLHQQPDTTPAEGMAAAFRSSHTLITAIRAALPQALADPHPKR